jgi:hypothetical protein
VPVVQPIHKKNSSLEAGNCRLISILSVVSKILEGSVHLQDFWIAMIFSRLTAGATGRQGMLTPPRHLIPPPVFPGVRVSPFIYLTCNSYLNFETDYSWVYWPFHSI